jgi:hypothetical protein
MRLCVRCSKACQATFCDECRSFLQEEMKKGSVAHRSMAGLDMVGVGLNPTPTISNPAIDQDVSTYTTSPQPIVENPATPLPLSLDQYATQVEQSVLPAEYDPVTPLPPVGDRYATQVEQAIQNLQDAARRIEAVEQREHRGPRVSRLSPLRDISADIQRDCTPSPGEWSKSRGDEMGEMEKIEDLGDVPDLWAWVSEMDSEDGDEEDEEDEEKQKQEDEENAVDPLLSRHFPSQAEVARIEEEDLRRAVADGLATTAQLEVFKRMQARRRLHVLVACLSVVAVLALTIDAVLASFVYLQGSHTHPVAVANTPPTFTLSSTVVTYGQKVTLYLRSFSPLSNVYLTHDINEPVMVKHGQAILQVGSDGSAQTTIAIDTAWEPGFHTLQAEDVKTHYTASVTLYVNEGSVRSSHFMLSATSLDFGTAAQGANTAQALTLRNSGSGAISWVASSNQPWLQITPNQGTFSQSQAVMVGGQRTNLQPGNYKGAITFTSNVAVPITVNVQMTVRSLPTDVGAVLAMAPAVLSYRAVDGGTDPSAQPVTISNAGKLPLYWSVASNAQIFTSANMVMGAFAGSGTNWLGANQSSGVVAPGQTATIQVQVHSGSLMPGVYFSALTLATSKGYNAYNAPQSVSISLTVQQHCSLLLNTGNLAFTAVAGQGSPSNQTLGLSASTGCSGLINWNVASSASWVTVAPASGQLKGMSTASVSVGINISSLSQPGVYTAHLLVMTGQSTQSVAVQLALQKQAMPNVPIISAGPLNLSFAANQGQTNLPGQMVTIANTGHSPLQWSSTANAQADPWLTITPTSGTIAPGQTGQMTVDVNAGAVGPGNYVAQIQLNGSDSTHAAASGSPQTVVVSFQVSAPCVLAQPSSSALAFSAMQGGNDPASQPLSITASGNCSWPLSWRAKGAPSWLNLSPSSGLLTVSNPTATMTVAPSIAGLSASQSAQVSLVVTDSTGEQVQGSAQSVGVSLTLQQPCSVQIAPGSIAFTTVQNQASITVQASNTCSSINWNATSDDGGKGWLSVDTANSGNGSIIVKADSSNLSVGTYSGSLSLKVTDDSGNPVQGGSQTIPVTLKVDASTFTVSGTVMTCADSACSSSQPLGAATVTLSDSAGQQVASVTADAFGNFSFSNVIPDSYTIAASGTDSSNVNYTGKATISVSGKQQVTIQSFTTSPASSTTSTSLS